MKLYITSSHDINSENMCYFQNNSDNVEYQIKVLL